MRRRHRQHAFSLAEMLIALAITAMLMAAMAAAIHSSLTSYRENEKSAALVQAARSILSRMMDQVRTAADIDSTASRLRIDQDETGLNWVEYQFYAGTLFYTQTVSGSTEWHELLAYDDDVSVTEFNVLREETPEGVPLSVTTRLVLVVKDRTFAMTATSAVRRFQSF